MDWNNMYYSVHDYNNINEYIDFIKKNTDLKGIDSPDYLTMHITCMYILQNYKTDYKLSLLQAENGPFLYLDKINWDYKYLLPIILYFKGTESPIVKYRGPDRDFINKLYLYKLYK